MLSTRAQPIAESNHTKCWLLPEEEEVILKFALEIASQGWPLEKACIKAHICHQTLFSCLFFVYF